MHLSIPVTSFFFSSTKKTFQDLSCRSRTRSLFTFGSRGPVCLEYVSYVYRVGSLDTRGAWHLHELVANAPSFILYTVCFCIVLFSGIHGSFFPGILHTRTNAYSNSQNPYIVEVRRLSWRFPHQRAGRSLSPVSPTDIVRGKEEWRERGAFSSLYMSFVDLHLD